MPLDVSTIAAVRAELSELVCGLRIDKVHQPQRDMIILTMRGKSKDALRLLISAGITDMRVHLTEHDFENPVAPPMFCMLLRKHLIGARIEAIDQPPSERMLDFTLSARAAMGEATEKHLMLELFGRIPNIILIDDEGIIIDCLRRVGGDMNSERLLLPGLRYHPPKPRDVSGASVAKSGGSAATEAIHKSPAAGADAAAAADAATPHPPHDGGISKALDAAYTRRTKEENMHRRSGELRKTMKTAQKRIARRLSAQRAELEQTDERDYARECGDIIMANLHFIEKGGKILIAEDFYAGGNAKREIKLDPLLTPQKNAAKYYKAYTKARNAVAHLTAQIAEGEQELEYVRSVLEQLARVESEQELDEIRGELVQTKYLGGKGGAKGDGRGNGRGNAKGRSGGAVNGGGAKNAKKTEIKPLALKSSSGIPILVGKNNVQNDKLTFKTASRSDTWLHAQKIHGAHVIIRSEGKAVDEATLREAAATAAYYSAARGSGKVPVDYTLVKHVKKLPNSRLGMVTYSEFKTILVKGEI